MTGMGRPFRGECPSCGHKLGLDDLKMMAVGDGWQRFLLVRHKDGSEEVVSFDDFNPATMEAISERVTSRPDLSASA